MLSVPARSAPDGELGAHTFQALTVPFAQRVRQIELTLERWRWLPPLEQPTDPGQHPGISSVRIQLESG